MANIALRKRQAAYAGTPLKYDHKFIDAAFMNKVISPRAGNDTRLATLVAGTRSCRTG
jgi:hypothetical protein